MEGTAIPIPRIKQLHLGARILGPCVTVRDRRVEAEDNNAEAKEQNRASLSDHWTIAQADGTNTSSDEVVDLTERNDGKVQGREVVVQEELSLHEEEGEIVEGPAEHGRANLIVEALELDVAVVSVASLPSEHGETLENNV